MSEQSNKVHYEFLRHEDPLALAGIVEAHLNNGFLLHGDPFPVDHPVNGTIYCQAVIKDDSYIVGVIDETNTTTAVESGVLR